MAIIAELLARLGVDTKQFEKELRQAEKALKKTAGNLISVGKSLTAGITLPLAAISGVAVKSFSDFDQALTQSTAIIDATSGQLQRLESTAREVARETIFSAKETAEAFFFLASAGLDVEQSIAALPQVAQFATAGMFDLGRATDLLTDAQSALGLVSKDAGENLANLTRVSDVLVKANTLANASVEQFSRALTNQAATAARAAKLELEDVVAVLAVFADQGIKGEEAGTKFAILLRDLTTKAAQNSEAFKKLGIDVFDVNKNLRPLGRIISDLERQLGGLGVETQKLTLLQLGFSDRNIGVIQTLLGTSTQLEKLRSKLDDVAGITKEVSEKQLQSFENRMRIIQSRVADAAISLGEVLAPVILDVIVPAVESFLERLEGLLVTFDKLDDGTQAFILTVAGVAAALGPVAIAVGVLTKAMGGLGTAAGRLVPIFAVGGLLLAGVAALSAELAQADDEIGDVIKSVAKLAEEADRLKKKDDIAGFAVLNRAVQENDATIRKLTQRIAELNEFLTLRNAPLARRELEEVEHQLELATIKAVQLQTALDKAFAPRSKPEPVPDDFQPQGPQLPFFETGVFGEITAGFDVIIAKSNESLAVLSERFALFGEAVKAPFVALFEFIGFKQEESRTLWDEYADFVGDANMRVAEIGLAAFDALAEGLAQTIVVAVQGTKDFGEAIVDIFSNIFASITQQLLAFIIKFIAVKIQQIVFETTAAEAKEGIGGLVAALIALPILIGATIALANAQSKKAGDTLKLASGGLIGADGLAFLHEGERVLTKDEVKNVDRFGGGGLDLTIMLDGRVIARKVMEHAPRELRLRSV